MNKKIAKNTISVVLFLVMIAALYYYLSLRATFYNGRTQYLSDTSQVLVAIDPEGKPWVFGFFNGGTKLKLRTLEERTWVDSEYYSGWGESMVFDQGENLWIAADGIYEINEKEQIWYNADNSGLASDRVRYLAIDNSNRLWVVYDIDIGTSGSGVSVFDGSNWSTFTRTNSGLPTNEVTTVAFDSENRVWLGTAHGLSIFDGTNWITYSQTQSGLVGEYVSSIAFDQENNAWIATCGDRGRLNVFDGENWRNYTLEDVGLEADYFCADLVIDHSGRVWVNNQRDVRIFQNGMWIGLSEIDGHKNDVYSMSVDSQGGVWLGKRRGLVAIDADYALSDVWNTQLQLSFLYTGGIWYISFILVCLIMAVQRDSMLPVAVALASGIIVTVAYMIITNPPNLFDNFPIPLGVNPGVYTTLGVAIGVFMDIRNELEVSKLWRNARKGFLLGLIIGFAQLVALMFLGTQ